MNFAEDLPGASAPFGFFDPLGLSAGKEESVIRRWRESELKHGRLAMLGALGIIVGEAVEEENTPLFNDKLSGPAMYVCVCVRWCVSLLWCGPSPYFSLSGGPFPVFFHFFPAATSSRRLMR